MQRCRQAVSDLALLIKLRGSEFMARGWRDCFAIGAGMQVRLSASGELVGFLSEGTFLYFPDGARKFRARDFLFVVR